LLNTCIITSREG